MGIVAKLESGWPSLSDAGEGVRLGVGDWRQGFDPHKFTGATNALRCIFNVPRGSNVSMQKEPEPKFFDSTNSLLADEYITIRISYCLHLMILQHQLAVLVSASVGFCFGRLLLVCFLVWELLLIPGNMESGMENLTSYGVQSHRCTETGLSDIVLIRTES